MEEREQTFTISQLEEFTGLPASTLRYYESEFRSYLRIRKTAGGHRRYDRESIERFLHLKNLIQEKGLSIREVKRSLAADQDPEKIREEMDLLLKVTEELTQENLLLRKSMKELADRVTAMEDVIRNKKGSFRWFK
jgi:DNA-binding transcriptional MerR regulator